MFSRKALFFFVALAVLGPVVKAAAQGTDPDLLLALASLPSVSGFEVGQGGGLVRLEGELTEPGDADPDQLAQAFLQTRRDLYPRAAGTTLQVAGILAVEDSIEVTLRQVVDGFWADGGPLVCRYGATGC